MEQQKVPPKKGRFSAGLVVSARDLRGGGRTVSVPGPPDDPYVFARSPFVFPELGVQRSSSSSRAPFLAGVLITTTFVLGTKAENPLAKQYAGRIQHPRGVSRVGGRSSCAGVRELLGRVSCSLRAQGALSAKGGTSRRRGRGSGSPLPFLRRGSKPRLRAGSGVSWVPYRRVRPPRRLTQRSHRQVTGRSQRFPVASAWPTRTRPRRSHGEDTLCGRSGPRENHGMASAWPRARHAGWGRRRGW